MIEIKNIPNPYKLSAKFYCQVEFPDFVEYKGQRYWATNKTGTVIKTGVPCAEYQFADDRFDSRIWLDANNNITQD